MIIIEWLVAILVVGGSCWILLGTLGLLRLPDVYNRLHATGMTATLGISLILVGATLYFQIYHGSGFRLVAALALLFLTGPAGTHLLVRAAYLGGVRPTERSVRDDLARAPFLSDHARKAAD